ncbi:MAG: hypothetical protein O2960_14350 [Verrucomicrobia bacterium]|nr:hypothetical protein [Verrucomicrobiota bacterium]
MLRSYGGQAGFSVDQSVRLEAGNTEGILRLIEYFLRCPFSQARMIRLHPCELRRDKSRSPACAKASAGRPARVKSSNKSRGLRTQGQAQAAPASAQNSASAPSAKQARKRWAALIKKVYEVDPLRCAKCGAEMRIISFIERDQGEVIEKREFRSASRFPL